MIELGIVALIVVILGIGLGEERIEDICGYNDNNYY